MRSSSLAALRAEGLSGRALRKLPFQASVAPLMTSLMASPSHAVPGECGVTPMLKHQLPLTRKLPSQAHAFFVRAANCTLAEFGEALLSAVEKEHAARGELCSG